MNNNKTENKTEDYTQNLSEELKNMLVKDLNLSEGTQSALEYIKTVGELCKYSEKELLRFSRIGKARLEEIERALKKHGLSLGMQTQETVEEKLDKKKNIDEIKNSSISYIISNKFIYNKFIENEIYTIGDICKLDMRQIDNIINSPLLTNEIIAKVHSYGLNFEFEEKMIADSKIMEEIKSKNRKYSVEQIKDMWIKNIFSSRTYVSLSRYGIRTIGELCDCSERNLKNIRGLGNKSLEEVKDIIKSLGLSLKSEEEERKQEEERLRKEEPTIEEKKRYSVKYVITQSKKNEKLYKFGVYTIEQLINIDEYNLYIIMGSYGIEKLISKIHELGLEFKFEIKRKEDTELIERIKKGEKCSDEEVNNIYVKNIPGLSTIEANNLIRNGIKTVGPIRGLNKEELSKINGIGMKTAQNVINSLYLLNLTVKCENTNEEKLKEKIEELKFAYSQLEKKKNEYKFKIIELEKQIKELKEAKNRVDIQQIDIQKQLDRYE